MEVMPGYKQTEVGAIPEDWEVIDLSSLCSLQRGFDITEATRVVGDIPVYSSSGIAYFHNKALVSPPGVVTGRKGILGKVFFIEQPFWPHDTTLWVKDFKGNHPAYVALVLRNFHLERLDAATSVPTLNRNNLAGHPIPHPPNRAEQEAIAEVLRKSDALIETIERLIAKKRLLKKGVMQKLLTGTRRLNGFANATTSYKQTEVGVIPEDWNLARLTSIADVRDGTHESPKYIKSGVPFVTSKNILGGKIDLQDITFISQEDADEVNKRSKVDRGDILMSMIGTVGNAALVDFEPGFCIKNVALIKPIELKVAQQFLIQVFRSSLYGRYIDNKLDGGIQKFISLGMLRGLDVPLPPTKAEQEAIADVLSAMDAEVALLEAQLAKYRQLKQGLMQKLLTGRIRLI